MNMNNRLFYREANGRGYLRTVDACLVDGESQEAVFHTEHDRIQAVRVYGDEMEFLFSDGDVEDYKLVHRRLKVCESEVYFFGGDIYSKDPKIRFIGLRDDSVNLPDYTNSATIRVNDCVVCGSGVRNTNTWNWEVSEEGSSVFAKESKNLSDQIGISSNLMAVGFNEKIDTLQFCQDII